MTARVVAVGRIAAGEVMQFEFDTDDFELDPDLWRKTQIEDDMTEGI